MNETPARATGRRFHLIELIGEGAYGEVYLAEQDSGAGFRRTVAIKLLHANVAKSPEAGRRMRDEARILGMLNHRNIVAVLDLIQLDDRWAVIMDHVPGADLEQVVHALDASDAVFPTPAALEIAACVCAALHSAHTTTDRSGRALEVVHRDIKPSNVRLTHDGDVKVLDFGVARVQLDAREAQTRGSAWLGTERYMAPERILCEADGPAGDVYATAATLVELLRGRPLGRTPVLEERHTPFVDDALEDVHARCPPEHADAIVDLLRASLAADPQARPSAEQLAASLRQLARQVPGEDLVGFCGRLLPLVPQLLAIERRPATGVLSERSLDGSGAASPAGAASTGPGLHQPPEDDGRTASPHEHAETLLPEDLADDEPATLAPAEAPGAPATTPTPTPGRSSPQRNVALGLVLALLVSVTGGAWAVGTLGSTSPATPAAPSTKVTSAPEVPHATPTTPASSPATPPSSASPPSSETPPPSATPSAEPPTTPQAEPPADAPPSDAPPPDAPPEPAPSNTPASADTPAPAAPLTPTTATVAAPEAPAPPPEEGVADPAPRVSGALVALADADSLTVTCGEIVATGTASVRLRDFPAGTCDVRATYLGAAMSAEVQITTRREVRCEVTDGALTCS